jgi:ubiquitin conjugation factor E4 B
LFFLKDGALIQHALSFYRLMLVWLVNLVGGFKMPLPLTCPKEFASMPEHFVEDAMELLIFASRIPKALDGVLLVGLMIKCFTMQFCLLHDMGNIVFFARALSMKFRYLVDVFCFAIFLAGQDDFMNFIIMFMASPTYIRNPYLRAKMVEVLNCWMPRRR